MNEDYIKQIARRVFMESAGQSQFSVAQNSLHTHNGSDNLRVSFTDLSNKGTIVIFSLPGTSAATAGNYTTFFTAPIPMTVQAVTEVHTALGTDGSAVTLDLEKLTGTTAPGSGTKLTASGISLKGAINTVAAGTLVSNTSVQLNTGDRLAALLTGTPTSVASVVMTVTLNFF